MLRPPSGGNVLDDAMSVREQLATIRGEIGDLERIMRVHENRWQRIIGVLLVVSFLGLGGLIAMVAMLWAILQAVT